MAYRCKKCGSDKVELLRIKKFEADAVFYENKDGKISDDNIGYGTEVRDVGIMLSCKNCNHDGLPEDFEKI